MRDIAFEDELEAHRRNAAGPLTYWRRLPFKALRDERASIEAAVASIVARTRLVPPILIDQLLEGDENDLPLVWLKLEANFISIACMRSGVASDIAGTCAALAAAYLDAQGLVILLNRLSQPLEPNDLGEQLLIAASWLQHLGVLINPDRLARIDWKAVRQLHAVPQTEDAE